VAHRLLFLLTHLLTHNVSSNSSLFFFSKFHDIEWNPRNPLLTILAFSLKRLGLEVVEESEKKQTDPTTSGWTKVDYVKLFLLGGVVGIGLFFFWNGKVVFLVELRGPDPSLF